MLLSLNPEQHKSGTGDVLRALRKVLGGFWAK
jgi:hypothetical protein